MQRTSLTAFLADPVKRFHSSGPLVLWAWSPSLVGISHFGHITAVDLPLLRIGAQLPFHPALARPYRAIIDVSRLTHIDQECFKFLLSHLDLLRARGAELISRLCVVRAQGLTGAAAIGLVHEYLGKAFETRFVATLGEALDDLVEPAERAELDAAVETVFSVPTLVDKVRTELSASPNMSIAMVASRVGVSIRTLQRALTTSETSHRDEAARARLYRARHLLAVSDETLDTIARRAGYSSAISMSRRIRDVYGTTPGLLRSNKSED